MLLSEDYLLLVVEDDPYFRDLWINFYGNKNALIFDYIESLLSSNIDFSKVILVILDYEIDQSDIVELCYVQKLREAGYKGPIALSSMHSFEHLEPEKQQVLRSTVDFVIPKDPIGIDAVQKMVSNSKGSQYANF